jgi:hypothetical protein
VDEILESLSSLGVPSLRSLFECNLIRYARLMLLLSEHGSWEGSVALGSVNDIAGRLIQGGSVQRGELLESFTEISNRVLASFDEAPLDEGYWPFGACLIANMCAIAILAQNNLIGYASDQVEECTEFAGRVDEYGRDELLVSQSVTFAEKEGSVLGHDDFRPGDRRRRDA